MNKISKILSAALLLLTNACTDAGFAVANTPVFFSGNAVVRHISYGPEKWQQMDLYVPKIASDQKMDTIVFFYGGGWKGGAKENYAFVAQAFAEKGYIVAIPDYRKYPQVKFPAFVEDGARALSWIHDHVGEYNGSKDRIFLSGHSAGAHIAALLVSDKHYLQAYGKTPKQVVRRFAGLSGPYAFTPDEPDYVAIFGPPERYKFMQVPTFIDGSEPPMLLMYGSSDDVVGRFNLDKLENRIREQQGKVRHIIYPDVGHIGIISALTWLNPSGKPVRDDMISFFQEK